MQGVVPDDVDACVRVLDAVCVNQEIVNAQHTRLGEWGGVMNARLRTSFSHQKQSPILTVDPCGSLYGVHKD